MRISRSLVLALSYACASASVTVVSSDAQGKVIQIDGPNGLFYATTAPFLEVDIPKSAGISLNSTPATVITSPHSPIRRAFLESQLEVYGNVDDVWDERFMKSLIISYTGQAIGFFSDDAKVWLRTQKLDYLFLSDSIQPPKLKKTQVAQIPSVPPPGPYLISSSSREKLKFRNVYRLFEDVYETFLFGAIPNPNGGWTATNITLNKNERGVAVQHIPIPSRLSIMSATTPLSGIRFGLKDLYDAEGLPTAAGSAAYALTHSIPNITAPSVQKLIALGATMVGKTRTSQFAHGAQPWEFNDVPYSWNPRGDGHLTAGSSSSGSACAIAGYEWLDFTVGSDTRGSVRIPAALVGVYGIRPTHGSMDLTGVVPLSEEMDTAGFFARDPRIFAEIQRHWYSDTPVISRRQTIRFPSKLLYPIDHFPVKNPSAQKLYDGFVTALQEHLKVEKVPINITTELTAILPDGDFSAFQRSSNKLAEYRSWTSVGQPIVNHFLDQFGQQPIFDPIPEKMFERARGYEEKDFLDAVEAKHNFRDSVAQNILKGDIKSCSESLFIYDTATGGLPSYRIDEHNWKDGATPIAVPAGHPDVPAKVENFLTLLGAMAGLPEITVPIGQVEYRSHVNNKVEMLPVAVQLVARRGCDAMLMELVKKLADNGVIQKVKTGKTAF